MEGKYDTNKPDYTLVPVSIIEAVERVRTMGTAKYGDPNNWKTISDPVDRYWRACLRHAIAAWKNPQERDAESGLRHIDHMACNLAFIMELLGEPKKEPKVTEEDALEILKSQLEEPEEVEKPEEPKPEEPKKARKTVDKGRVLALRGAGWSVQKIADDMDICTQTVYNVLNEAKTNEDN